MAPVRRWKIPLAVLAALACFALGVGSARFLGGASPGPTPLADAGPRGVALFPDAGPKVFVDPDAIKLLPDASLRLDLPPMPLEDAAAPP
jgi:hypothetical protein